MKKKTAKVLHKVISTRNLKLLKWGSILAGITTLVVTYILKENHMMSTAITAGVYEGSRMAQEFMEPVIRALENLTEGSEEAVSIAEELAEEALKEV